VNVRSLSPGQLRVLLVLRDLGFAVKAEVIAEACLEEGLAEQALTGLLRRGLAEAGSFYDDAYGYRLTADGTTCARKAAA
jgi:hypothetical protein